MKIAEIIKISMNNLTANKMRSALTIVGISVGISSIVFLVSLGYGLQDLSIKKIAAIEAINTIDVAQGSKGTPRKIDSTLISELKADPGISKVSPVLAIGIKIVSGDKIADGVGNCVDKDFFALEGLEVTYGSFFTGEGPQAVVTSGLLKAINQTKEDILNKDVAFNIIIANAGGKKEVSKDLKIVGVIKDDTTSLAYIPLSLVAGDVGENPTYNAVKVKIVDQNKIQEMKAKIDAMGFTATSIADTIDQVDRIFKYIQIGLAFFGFVALLVASIGMFNTMTVALLERTRDIGIMKALGVSDFDIAKMFLSESALIAFSGGTLGVASGWLISKIINYAVNALAQSVGGEPHNLFVTPLVFSVGIIIFSGIVGLATGFYPSRRASRLNPLDALRYE